MAYNLQPLITTLEQILNPQQTQWIVDDDKPQLQSLLEKSVSLQQIFEETSLSNIESLESEIRDAAHKAEDIIESHMADQMLSRLDVIRDETHKAEDMIESHMIDRMLSRPGDGDVILDRKKSQPKSLLKKMVYKLQQICNPKTEDMIEPHMVHQMLSNPEAESHKVHQMISNPEGVSLTFSTRDLQQVMQELDSVMEQVMKLIMEKMLSTGRSASGVPFSHNLSSKSIVHEDSVQSKAVVGIDADLSMLKDRVMGMQSKLEIVPIVGMGGIGKTTLARKLYEDPSIVEHFEYAHAWATISHEYNMKAIILSLLRCIIGKECDQHMQKGADELKNLLYKRLYGRRYMIVLDDIWSSQFWDEIRMYFPDNINGSRIVITTRESEVAKHANSHSKQHEMQLLDESESWNLLRQEAFGDEEDCSAALEIIGRNIARNCGGLPLAICVIGGLLSKADMSEDVWENVANDVRAAIAESDGQFSDILSLSYNHMPTHLRPCFLYMGAFPEDYEIKASRLIRLWVAEGFLKSNGEKSLEEEAEDCLKALIDRNLVSVRAVKSDGRPHSCGMHDLMRDLCLKKAEERRFVHVGKKEGGEVEGIRRVSIHPSYRNINLFYASESMSLARSFLCIGQSLDIIPSDVLLALRLLRVLDLIEMNFSDFPKEILLIVNLRYLAFSLFSSGQLPSGISRLCNLQTLVMWLPVFHSISLPCEILQMAELRHLMVYRGTIFFESRDGSDWGGFVLDKLQTIFSLKSSHEFLHRIPNLKKLGIQDSSSIFDLYHLHKLETLRFSRAYLRVLILPSTLRLPPSLKNLSLAYCKIVGEFMNYLCELPNLEVLKLRRCSFEGGEWDATQQEFCTLQFLRFERVQLVKWEADETNFPRLRRLVIRDCRAVEEIPSGIGEIPTLQTIELDNYSSPSLVASAKLIIEEQRDNGNDDLQLRLV